MRPTLYLALGYLAVACGSPPEPDKPTRSPSQDYENEPRTTSDGEVVGADAVSPEDKLQTGANLGGSTEDPTPEARPAPGWSTDDRKGLSYDPKKRVGGRVSEPKPAEGAQEREPDEAEANEAEEAPEE